MEAQANFAHSIESPTISLPKGGGALAGLGETFQPNLFSGTSSYSIRFPLTKSRGLEPDIQLNYHSGTGNGIFGIGFSLPLSKISIRTEKGIPTYDGRDTYMLDASPLVPKNNADATDPDGWNVRTYYNKLESDFVQIELHSKPDGSDSYWKITDDTNQTSWYGRTDSCKIYHPDCPSCIYEWLIDETQDAKGNKIRYQYKKEDDANIIDKIWETNRSRNNRYIHSIEYGNYLRDDATEGFAFEVLFNYGEYDSAGDALSDPYQPVREWDYRMDAFSAYACGFEIRTCRLCRSILLFHHFERELGDPCLVKSLSIEYNDSASGDAHGLSEPAMAKRITLAGYRRLGTHATDRYEIKRMPALKLSFSQFRPPPYPQFTKLQVGDTHLPGYLNGGNWQLIDFNQESIAGLLYCTDNSIYYCEPLGEYTYRHPKIEEEFPLDLLHKERRTASLIDLEGNGELELIVNQSPGTGFYQKKSDGRWGRFQPLPAYPTELSGGEYETVGLANNGKTDALLIDGSAIRMYPSLGKQGFGPLRQCVKPKDFPAIRQGATNEKIGFASLAGDGLAHRYRISNGYCAYWPNMGYGHFGAEVCMGNAPVFGNDFDSSRLFLADIDGSGTADLIYVSKDKVELYLNHSGDYFSEAITVYLPVRYDQIDQISFADVLGNGTTCLVFTKVGTEVEHYCYNFVGENSIGTEKQTVVKPYLLCLIDNSLGVATRIEYTSSTQFYLQDKASGRPWVTRLPFPVQLVRETIVTDRIRKFSYTQRFSYHDGYYDPVEKEFRGFGCVESWEGEKIEAEDAAPLHSIHWYHTGACFEKQDLSIHYKRYYFKGDKYAYDFPDSVFDPAILDEGADTIRQACSALSGLLMRTEVYGEGACPYTVGEFNAEVKLVQKKGENVYAVLRVNHREEISYQYEQNCNDPQVRQTFILETDDWGNPLSTCTVYLPRRYSTDFDIHPEQRQLRGVVEQKSYVQSDHTPLFCHTECERRSLEISGLHLNGKLYFTFSEISSQVQTALQEIIFYGTDFAALNPQARVYSWNRAYFWNESQRQPLALGQISSRGMLHHTEKAVFPEQFAVTVFDGKLTGETIQSEGGYFADSGYWWNRGLVMHYFGSETPGRFYLPCKTENSFVDTSSYLFSRTELQYDSYCLFAISMRQYIDEQTENRAIGEIDYTTCQLKQLTDANGNIRQVLFDPLAQVIVTTLFGTENGLKTGGMSLYPDGEVSAEYQLIPCTTLSDVIAHPDHYLQGACSFFFYESEDRTDSLQPLSTIHLERCDYYHTATPTDDPYCQIAIGYYDGLNREIETKQLTPEGKWLVSARTVFNNKGNPYKKYLPYFSDYPEYELQPTDMDIAPTVIHYDPLGREIRVDTPKGFFTKTERTAWEERQYDENDTVKDSPYYQSRFEELDEDERDAVEKALPCQDTPNVVVTDNVGHAILIRNDERTSSYLHDIAGRDLIAVDPRFYEKNKSEGSRLYNFMYMYAMESDTPLVVDSCDGGVMKGLSNIYGNQFYSWTARDYCQLIGYDRLQRKRELKVKKIDVSEERITSFDDFNTVERFIYGETRPQADELNLKGQLYRCFDLSGCVTYEGYSIQGEALSTERRFVKEYKQAPNWDENVVLEEETYLSRCTYNALKQVSTETAPDLSVVINTHDCLGRLRAVSVAKPGEEGYTQRIIDRIEYNAEGERAVICYGNGIKTVYSYEATTHRLSAIQSRRPVTPDTQPMLQDICYFYDPVGNVTRIRDNASPIVFCHNQEIRPVMDYTYDLFYQLIHSSGRQHAEGNIYTVQPQANDTGKLENYEELYTYDRSGNLVKKRHISASASRSKETPASLTSNRLKDMVYDASGNMRYLDTDSSISLSYNCCDRLVKSTIIRRDGQGDDAEYYLYDSAETRVRRVCERYANGGENLSVEDKVYCGSYEVKRRLSVNGETRVCLEERQALRIMDDKACVAIIYYTADNVQHPEEKHKRSIRFQMDNNIGSVALETDENALLVTYEEYYPFGGTAFIIGVGQAEVSRKEYRYSGQERDDNTGLYYYGVRYYAPWLGRWTRPDPTGPVDGMNLYAFVNGNPITAKDLKGRAKYVSMAVKAAPILYNATIKGVQSYKSARQRGDSWAYSLWRGVSRGALAATTTIVGDKLLASNMIGAHTAAMAVTSTISSTLDVAFKMSPDYTTNLGAVRMNWTTNTVTHPFSRGLSTMDRLSLAMGATLNYTDIKAGVSGTTVTLLTEPGVIGHSALTSSRGNISVGPASEDGYDFGEGIVAGRNDWPDYADIAFTLPIHNVNGDVIHRLSETYTNNSNTTELPYSFFPNSCVGYASDALLKAGAVTPSKFALHPSLFYAYMSARDFAIRTLPQRQFGRLGD